MVVSFDTVKKEVIVYGRNNLRSIADFIDMLMQKNMEGYHFTTIKKRVKKRGSKKKEI